jgi:iron complex transport system substrate-binding protein
MKICCLLPGVAETLYELHAEDMIVAVSHDCDYPPEVTSKPIISRSVLTRSHLAAHQVHETVEARRHRGLSLHLLDNDLLRELKPDIIFTQALCEVCAVHSSQVVAATYRLDYEPKIVSLQPRTIGEVLENVLLIGRLVGREGRAQRFVDTLKSRVGLVESTSRTRTHRPRVLVLEWTSPPMAGGLWIPEMVDIAGGTNVVGYAGGPATTLSWNTIRTYTPDIVVAAPCGYSLEESAEAARQLSRSPHWDSMVGKSAVYAVNSKWYFSRSGPRLVGGLEALAEIINPELRGKLAPQDSYTPI